LGYSKDSAKRKLLPPSNYRKYTREISIIQPNDIPQTPRKNNNKPNPKLVDGNKHKE
jgi:hypothetical protein